MSELVENTKNKTHQNILIFENHKHQRQNGDEIIINYNGYSPYAKPHTSPFSCGRYNNGFSVLPSTIISK